MSSPEFDILLKTLEEEREVKLAVGCASCGDINASLRCTRCRIVVYCTPLCQRAHWPTHKPKCIENVSEGEIICTHGAPTVAAEPSSALAVSQLVRALTLEPTAMGQLSVLLDTARGDKGATTGAALAMLRSAALDAALSADLDGARSVLRARAFMESYGVAGEEFVSVLCGSGSGSGSGSGNEMGRTAAENFSTHLDALTTRVGLMTALIGVDSDNVCSCIQRVHLVAEK
jgi:hypothetical protein